MKSLSIAFRLKPYQIARGLLIIRKLDPTYQPTSPSQLAKMLYLDYLAKMTLSKTDIVPTELIDEVRSMVGISKKVTLSDIQTAAKAINFKPNKHIVASPVVEDTPDDTPDDSVDDFEPIIIIEPDDITPDDITSDDITSDDTTSVINTVINFQPSGDWLASLEDDE